MKRFLCLLAGVVGITALVGIVTHPRATAQGNSADANAAQPQRASDEQAERVKRYVELLGKQEDLHKRAEALFATQDQLLKRQEADMTRYEKVLETWENQQKQYQKYLDSLPR